MRIDYYLYSAHEIDTWEPVRAALLRRGVDARYVLEPPGLHTAMGSSPDPARGWLDDKSGRIVPLMTEATHQELTELLAGVGAVPLHQGRYDADAVMTTQGTGWLHRYAGAKLRISYGVGATIDSWNHGLVNDGLDAVLTHGEFSGAAIRSRIGPDRVHVTGFPKYARFLRRELDTSSWQGALGLPAGRPTIVWACTWAHSASIERYAAAIEDLARHANVVCKPHHNNFRFERARIEALRARPGIVVEERTRSLVPFLAIADLVLADVRSGSFTEAFLADRPVVGLSPNTDPADDRLIAGVDDAALICRRPEDLPGLVDEALDEDRFAAGRRRLARWFFEDLAGEDDERTAQAVIDVVTRRRASRVPTATAPPAPAPSVEPWPLATTAAQRVLAWPRWDRPEHLVALLLEASRLMPPGSCLCLRRDPDTDVPPDVAVRSLQAAYDAAHPTDDGDLEVLLVDDRVADVDLPRLGAAVSGVIACPSDDDAPRAAFLTRLGAPILGRVAR